MPTVKEVIDNLKKNHKDDEHVAVSIWTVDDVKSVIEERGLNKVTDEEAGEILDTIHHKQDANDGISWDTLEFYIIYYFDEKNKKLTGI